MLRFKPISQNFYYYWKCISLDSIMMASGHLPSCSLFKSIHLPDKEREREREEVHFLHKHNLYAWENGTFIVERHTWIRWIVTIYKYNICIFLVKIILYQKVKFYLESKISYRSQYCILCRLGFVVNILLFIQRLKYIYFWYYNRFVCVGWLVACVRSRCGYRK